MKKLFCTTMSAIAIVIGGLMALTSCSGSDKVESVIPSDIDFAVKIDMTRFIDNAGGSVAGDGTITLPGMSNNPMAMAMANKVIEMLKAFNLSNMVVFGDDSDEIVFVAEMRDSKAAADALKQMVGEPVNENGYEVYKIKRTGVIATKDDLLYFAEKFDHITDAEKKAQKSSISSLPAISEWINSTAAITAVVNADELDLPNEYKNYWLCGSLDVDGQSMTGELVLMDKDGKRSQFGEAFAPVSTDFLAYIPEGTQSVMALGEIVSPELKRVISQFASQIGESGKYLTDLNGTMSLALAVNPNVDWSSVLMNMSYGRKGLSADDLAFVAMLHYPQTTLNSLINQLDDNARMSGQIPTVSANGMHRVDVDGYMNLEYGNVDGYFAISNDVITGETNNDFAPLVEGTRAVAASIQQPGQNPYGLEWGTRGRVWLTNDAVKMEVSVTNTSKKFLEAIGELMSSPKFIAQMQEAIQMARQMSSGLSSVYDYDDLEDYYNEVDGWNEEGEDYSPLHDETFGGYDPDLGFTI